MHIRRIELENVRGFPRVDLDLTRPDGSLAGWTVVAGRNGAGKTTLLQAVAIAMSNDPLLNHLDHPHWIRHGARTAKLVAHNEGGAVQRITYFTGKKAVPVFDDFDNFDDNRFLAAYGSFRRLSGHATDAQRLMADTSPASRVVTLFREDASLAEAVQWLREVYLRRLEEKPGAKELEVAALDLLRSGLLPGGAVVEKVDSDGLWVRENGISLPLTQLSDGYRTVTALILDIVRHLHATFGEFRLEERDGSPVVPYEGVVLIDEIDSHLHVSWQQRIGSWLKQHFPNIQFIVTTHSPFICQAADPRGIVRLPAPGEDRVVEHVPDELYTTIVNGTADEAVMTELFGLEYPYSEASEDLRKRVAELEFKMIRDGLSEDEQALLDELSDQLPRTASGAVERALRKLQGT
jgi:hypothetical protein